jgi:hypothetical protein
MTIANIGAQVIFSDDFAISAFGKKSRRRSNALNLAARVHLPPYSEWTSVNTKFQAGRTCIQYEGIVIHKTAFYRVFRRA